MMLDRSTSGMLEHTLNRTFSRCCLRDNQKQLDFYLKQNKNDQNTKSYWCIFITEKR